MTTVCGAVMMQFSHLEPAFHVHPEMHLVERSGNINMSTFSLSQPRSTLSSYIMCMSVTSTIEFSGQYLDVGLLSVLWID